MSCDCIFGRKVVVSPRKMETEMDNRSLLSLPAFPGQPSREMGLFHTLWWPLMIIHYFQARRPLLRSHIPEWFMKKGIYISVLHMHGPLSPAPIWGERLSYKNTSGEIIDLHLFMREEAEHLPAVRPGGLDARIPKVPSHPSVLFTVALNRGQGLQSVSALPWILFTAAAWQ